MIESYPGTTIFLALESLFLLLQCLFMFTKLRTKLMGRFLIVNSVYVIVNVLYFFEGATYSVGFGEFAYQSSLFLLLISVFWYLGTMFKPSLLRKKSHLIAIVSSILSTLVLAILAYFGVLNLEELIPLGAITSLMIFISVFLAAIFVAIKKFYAVLFTVVLSINLTSFAVYAGKTLLEFNIFLNAIFVILSAIHLYMFFRNLKEFVAKMENNKTLTLREELATYKLTQRQIEVAELVIQGHSSKEIGAMFGRHKDTITKHVSNINDKVGVKSREELRRKFISYAKSNNQG